MHVCCCRVRLRRPRAPHQLVGRAYSPPACHPPGTPPTSARPALPPGRAQWTYYNDSKKNCGARCIRAVHHGGADVGSDNQAVQIDKARFTSIISWANKS
jgi:hypothetical protein